MNRITLLGIDHSVLFGSDVVTVTVESDFDRDGIPDSAESPNFWNPGDAGMIIGGLTRVDRSRGLTTPLTGTAGLQVSPFGVNLTVQAGQVGVPASLIIRSTGLNELAWTASKLQPWLTLSATGGSTLDVLDLTPNATALSK